MPSAYRGDDMLATLLRSADLPVGTVRTVAEVRDLLDGVLAAPQPADPDAWLALIPPGPGQPALPAELRAELVALRAELAADHGDPLPDPHKRLADLRRMLREQGLDAFLVPRGDEHQGEYVPPRAQRLAWLTGFTGSAGLAAVGLDKAAIFVDGRYTLQVQAEVPGDLYEYRHLIDEPLTGWLAAALPAGSRIGFDPWLHTMAWVERASAALARHGLELVSLPVNPLDAVWADQPPPPLGLVRPHDIAFAGQDIASKCTSIADRLSADGVDVLVLTQPDSIAWLLNLRGADVPCTPLPLSFATLAADGQVELFIDRRKLVPSVAMHLGSRVTLRAPGELGVALDAIGKRKLRVLVDPNATSAWIVDRLRMAGAAIEQGNDPCALPKARKNATELAGTRAAHVRDGAALVRFLAWLDEAAATGTLTELEASDRLRAFRAVDPQFRDLSFETIAGAGPNGAIVHYRVTPETNRLLEPGSLFLLDSGAQYPDGTTDVTRTIAIGEPTAEMRDRFTRVLKGHIALDQVVFPSGTSGSQLDALARRPLWQAGLDYDHGTGHGVGSFLSVHEGPQRISKVGNTVALEPGMILSNEPGYYKTGAYGIRIENLIVVEPRSIPGAERPVLGFAALTLVPIDRRLIDVTLLSPDERAWVDRYHDRVRAVLSERLDEVSRRWLNAATMPLPAVLTQGM